METKLHVLTSCQATELDTVDPGLPSSLPLCDRSIAIPWQPGTPAPCRCGRRAAPPVEASCTNPADGLVRRLPHLRSHLPAA